MVSRHSCLRAHFCRLKAPPLSSHLQLFLHSPFLCHPHCLHMSSSNFCLRASPNTSASGHLKLLPPGIPNLLFRAPQLSALGHLKTNFWVLGPPSPQDFGPLGRLSAGSDLFGFRVSAFGLLGPRTSRLPGVTTLTIGSGFLTLRSPPVAGFYSPLVRVGLAAAEPRNHSFLPFRTSAHSSSSDHLSPSFPPPFQLSTPLPTNPPHPQHTTLLPPPPRPSTYQPSPGLAPAKPRGGPPQIPSFLPSSSLSSRLHESSMLSPLLFSPHIPSSSLSSRLHESSMLSPLLFSPHIPTVPSLIFRAVTVSSGSMSCSRSFFLLLLIFVWPIFPLSPPPFLAPEVFSPLPPLLTPSPPSTSHDLPPPPHLHVS